MPIFQVEKAEAELRVSDTVLLCKLQSGLWLKYSSMLLYPNSQYALSDHVVLQGLRAKFLAVSKSLFMSLFDNGEALFFCPFLPDLVLNNPTVVLLPPPPFCGSQWCLLFFWSLPGVDWWCGKGLFLWHPEGFSNRSPLLKFKDTWLSRTNADNWKKGEPGCWDVALLCLLSEPDAMASLVRSANNAEPSACLLQSLAVWNADFL